MRYCKNCGKLTEHAFCTGDCKRVYVKDYAIYINQNGDDIIGDGSKGNPFKTIERALECAKNRKEYVICQVGMEHWF